MEINETNQLAEAEAIIAGQSETIAALEAQVAALKANPSAVPVIEVDGESYEVHAPSFQYGTAVYTRAQLLNNPALQAELVAMGAGFLKKQTVDGDSSAQTL